MSLDHAVPSVALASRQRSPRLGQALSVLPGLGQLYYGAWTRAAQYFAGVVLSFLAAAQVYNLSFDLAHLGVSPILTSIGFLLSELVALSLIVSGISFWIAARWDARQGIIALNNGVEYRPRWWFVKLKEFLFDEPEAEMEKVDD
jgi:hypothetical protein